MQYPHKLGLWPHQLDAIATVSNYLDKHANKTRKSFPAALVNIPTGGGKTAVIGVLAHWHTSVRRALVLAPRTPIRDQLYYELSARRGFFKDRGYLPETMPKQVLRFRSTRDIPVQLPEDAIFVCTIQLLTELADSTANADKKLAALKRCEVVVMDEGHYEPAPKWAAAIRGLARPTVLVTATPYRNDLKAFELDSHAQFITRYDELSREGWLRKVKVEQLTPHSSRTPAAFVESVLTAFAKNYGSPPSSKRKLIIRCKTRVQIQQLGDAIRQHPLGIGGVLSLHENFRKNTHRDWERRHPSDPEHEDAPAIWIHQHKLLEGVDGPSFRALAIYGVLGSGRALVQQIGRIVRNPKRDQSEKSLLMDHSDGAIEAMWDRFKKHDRQVTAKNMQKGLREFYAEVSAATSQIIYVDRQFREPLCLSTNDHAETYTSLRLPLRCNLYALRKGGSLEALHNATKSRFIEEDFPFAVVRLTSEQLLIVYVKVGNSPLLEDHYFVEPTLHAFIAIRIGTTAAVLDTARQGLDDEGELALGFPIGRTELSRLLTSTRNTRLIQVVTRNSSLGPSSIRRRALQAPSLSDVPPSLDEFQFVASSVTAADSTVTDDDEAFRMRAVGFANARISDSARRVGVDEWTQWSKQLCRGAGDRQRKSPKYLERYAKQIEGPINKPAARNILMDIDEARNEFVVALDDEVATDGDPLHFEDACLDCSKLKGKSGSKRALEILANGVPCTATVEFVGTRYVLASSDLERRYRHHEGLSGISIVDFLNDRQAFVIVPEESNAIYADGGFYRPGLVTGPEFSEDSLGLSDVLEAHPGLRDCHSEKGGKASAVGTTWAANSVFKWIDDHRNQLLPNTQLMVCDDGKNECCDFLLVGERNGRPAIAMIHAKASSSAQSVAASALHEVCSQAAKHVGTLALFNPQKPVQLASWAGAWNGPNGEGRVDQRIRRASGSWQNLTAAEIWAKVSALLERHSTHREVLLVLGASIEKDTLFARARRKDTSARVIQALHLLRSTMAAIAGAGARLRVLCNQSKST